MIQSDQDIQKPPAIEKNDLDARFNRMTTEPVSKLIFSLAIPTIVSMLVMALYNMADTFFVGKISTTATAAIGVVFPVMTTIQVVGMTIGVGSGSFVARLLGQKNRSRASQVVSTAFYTAIVSGAIIAILGEIFMVPVLRLLGASETILPYANDYARYILIGAPLMAASFVMNVNLRSEGSAFLAMLGLTSGAIINIGLDPIFIFTFEMGVAGAAIATVISQMISFSILISHYIFKRSSLDISLKNFCLDKAIYWEMLRSGSPTLARQSLVTVAAIILNKTAGFYGDAAIAGMTVISRITIFVESALIGFGQGFQPVAAFNYTAGRYDRVYQAFWFSVKVGAVGLLCGAVPMFLFAPTFVKFFRNDPEVVIVGALALRYQAVVMPFNSFMVMSNMMFQYIGLARKALILSMSRQGFVFVPAILILSKLFGLYGVQISQAVANGMGLFVAIYLASGTLKKLKEDMRNSRVDENI